MMLVDWFSLIRASPSFISLSLPTSLSLSAFFPRSRMVLRLGMEGAVLEQRAQEYFPQGIHV